MACEKWLWAIDWGGLAHVCPANRAVLGCGPPNRVLSAPASCGQALSCLKEWPQRHRTCVSTELLPSALAPISSRNHRGCRASP